MATTQSTQGTAGTAGAAIETRIKRYLDEGLAAVTGWFDDESAEVIAELLLHQVRSGTAGDVAEIGVHHGKSFLLLANGLDDGQRAVALDVFDDQHLNVDESGHGDRAVLEANVATWADPASVSIVQASSTDLTPEGAPDTFGEVRLFSVDGGHTAAITAHDLRLAEAVLVPDGIVVLDDILNPHWLGVLTGLRDYLGGGGTLRPFAMSSNKLYLASEAAAPGYADHLRGAMADLLGKREVEFFDASIDVYGMGSPRRRRSTAAVAEQRARTSALERTSSALTARNAELEAELSAVRADLVTTRAARAAAERRVSALVSSSSWRATGPLRLAGRAAKRVRGRRAG